MLCATVTNADSLKPTRPPNSTFLLSPPPTPTLARSCPTAYRTSPRPPPVFDLQIALPDNRTAPSQRGARKLSPTFTALAEETSNAKANVYSPELVTFIRKFCHPVMGWWVWLPPARPLPRMPVDEDCAIPQSHSLESDPPAATAATKSVSPPAPIVSLP